MLVIGFIFTRLIEVIHPILIFRKRFFHETKSSVHCLDSAGSKDSTIYRSLGCHSSGKVYVSCSSIFLLNSTGLEFFTMIVLWLGTQCNQQPESLSALCIVSPQDFIAFFYCGSQLTFFTICCIQELMLQKCSPYWFIISQ